MIQTFSHSIFVISNVLSFSKCAKTDGFNVERKNQWCRNEV